LEKLIEALKDKSLPNSIVDSINRNIEDLNSISDSANDLRSQIKAKQSNLIKLLEKEIKIVPKNYTIALCG
jgi:ABC-type transporter Mla subunit MlaD